MAYYEHPKQFVVVTLGCLGGVGGRERDSVWSENVNYTFIIFYTINFILYCHCNCILPRIA
jgi:hypothetical protein